MDDTQFKMLYDAVQSQTGKLDDLHGDFREFKGKVDSHLTDVDTHLNTIDKQFGTDRMWSRIQTVAVVPIVAALHIIAAKLGVKV